MLSNGGSVKDNFITALLANVGSRIKVNCVSQVSLNSTERQQYEALMKKYPATRDEDGLIDSYWGQKERQRAGNHPISF